MYNFVTVKFYKWKIIDVCRKEIPAEEAALFGCTDSTIVVEDKVFDGCGTITNVEYIDR